MKFLCFGCIVILALFSAVYAQTEQIDHAEITDNRPPEKPEVTKANEASTDKESSASDTTENEDEDQGSRSDEPKKSASEIPEWVKLRETDQEYAACRLALSVLGTKYKTIPEITSAEDSDCGIARPIHVEEIIPGIILQGGADIRCDTARALGFWARDFLRPAAATLPDAPRLAGLQLGSTYACRARVGTGNKRPKISQHAVGNAIDIMAFEFSNGETLTVEPRQDTGNFSESFQRSAQSTACLYFSTVLGPGSNAAHGNHLHLDVITRKNGWRLCQ